MPTHLECQRGPMLFMDKVVGGNSIITLAFCRRLERSTIFRSQLSPKLYSFQNPPAAYQSRFTDDYFFLVVTS